MQARDAAPMKRREVNREVIAMCSRGEREVIAM
jgi:hypothetical protein